MSKRFIDTGLFDDDWFMGLSKDGKILWMYFITKCDHAGILKLNVKLCKVQTEVKDLNESIKELANRLVTVSEQLYFIPKFIEFQYPGFPNSRVRAQQSAIEILSKYNLLDKENLTVKEQLPNCYEHEHEHEHGSESDNGYGDRSKIPPKIEWVKKYCEDRHNGIDPQYFLDKNTATGWTYNRGKSKIVDWQAHIRTWEKYSKNKIGEHGITEQDIDSFLSKRD